MTNPMHFEQLSLGVVAWNQWREANPKIRPDLRGAYLNGVSLPRINLQDADLRYAFLFRADLRFANLDSAVLIGADLIQARLEQANLVQAALSGAYLTHADLSYANLTGADRFTGGLFS
jgi:uncharacterized protein YjbI with pentapeptide repeats